MTDSPADAAAADAVAVVGEGVSVAVVAEDSTVVAAEAVSIAAVVAAVLIVVAAEDTIAAGVAADRTVPTGADLPRCTVLNHDRHEADPRLASKVAVGRRQVKGRRGRTPAIDQAEGNAPPREIGRGAVRPRGTCRIF